MFSMTSDLLSYRRGWMACQDDVLNLLNTIDTEALTVEEVRRRIYKEVSNLNPRNK
jgi:hypothetical protein